ncbi:hypothetical protein [Halioxenophilus sp. WMMB6]|uniref:hypothetical protein n=1 Tax=Halioxenophilus sp. WMMB6 TaxID=3073815 RepID=UPI00295F27F2|nr:hypothetical protein [Halioxenophilus sp. WMMB6]
MPPSLLYCVMPTGYVSYSTENLFLLNFLLLRFNSNGEEYFLTAELLGMPVTNFLRRTVALLSELSFAGYWLTEPEHNGWMTSEPKSLLPVYKILEHAMQRYRFIMILVGFILTSCQSNTQSLVVDAEVTVTPDATVCNEPRPEICTREYRPVCAHLADGSTSQYPSGCTACADPMVDAWLPGECQ